MSHQGATTLETIADPVKDDATEELTILVFDPALIEAVDPRLGFELDVSQFEDGCHQLQHRLHLVLHEAHDLHGILGTRQEPNQPPMEQTG